MARSYDGAGNTSAREQVEHGKQLEKARNQKIEFGVIIGAAAIAGLSILINTGKCISAANATKDYNAQQVEAEATLEELNAKLQDPAAQNYVYKDPTIGNMKETGQAIAMMQNQIIAANQSHSGLTYNDSTDSGDHVASTSQTGGGAVTLDPTDLAPSGSKTPDSETVEKNEATITPDNSSDSDYTYTPISNFDNILGIGTETNTSVPDTTTTTTASAPVVISNGKNRAQLIKDFKQNYFAQQIANVDNVPGTENTAWSWYGYWEFSGTYDYSVNEVPQMSAVWTCYEPSDVGHLRPLAFVTATYTESTKRFTNPTAYYTQYYVNAAKAQSDAHGSQSNNNSDNVALTPDDQNKNGEGSENEYQLNITEDDIQNNSDNNENVTLTPDTDTTNPGTTNTQPSDTTQPSNPSGSATWIPGSGATPSSGNNNSGGTVTWNPNGNGTGTGTGTGTWNPSGSSSSSNSGSAGTWVPAK